MQHEARNYVHDAERACSLIAEFTENVAEPDYISNILLQSAVERQFITVGEALGLAVKLEPALVTQITELRRIVNFRNVMVHGYALIEPRTVWQVVTQDLPALRSQLVELLTTTS
jgi:uncharacterized protein with HEPN domain